MEEENKILRERNREYLLKLEKETEKKQIIDRGNIQVWNRGLPVERALFTDTQNSDEEKEWLTQMTI